MCRQVSGRSWISFCQTALRHLSGEDRGAGGGDCSGKVSKDYRRMLADVGCGHLSCAGCFTVRQLITRRSLNSGACTVLRVWVEWKFCSSSFLHNFPNTADTLNRSKTLDMIWAALVKAGSSRSTYCQKGQIWSGEEARVALKQGRASGTTRSSGLLSFETWEFTNKIWEVILWAIWSQKKDECVSKEFLFFFLLV